MIPDRDAEGDGFGYGGAVNVILMGLRGSGKSTIGRLVAPRLGLAFVDLDDETPRLLGFGGVAEAWEARGEAEFRRAECEALGRVLGADGQVIALGGGTPLAPGAADALRAAVASGGARLVYLRAEPGALRARLAQDGNGHRPSLTGRGVVDEVDEVFAARDPLYVRLAQYVIDVTGKSADDVVRAIEAIV